MEIRPTYAYKGGRVQVTTVVTTETYEALIERADRHGQTVGAEMREMLEYLTHTKPKGNKRIGKKYRNMERKGGTQWRNITKKNSGF